VQVVDRERWNDAQDYERTHWERIVQESGVGGSTLKWYGWKARILTGKMNPFLDLSRATILEIGSGPLGVVSFMKGAAKYSVDPLEDFYKVHPALTELRDEETEYCKGMGESLPFEADYFDFVIIDNVIDHCQSPGSVLSEIGRVLKPQGFLYFTVNLHTRFGSFVRFFIEFLKLDRGHPFTFSLGKTRTLLKEMGFSVLDEEIEDYRDARRRNISSKKMKRLMKGLIGAAEFEYKAVCRRIGR
jgi:SAM-dependent methyltransferase